MAKKEKPENEAFESFKELYADGGIVNLGEHPREPEKSKTGRPSIEYLTDGGLPNGRLIIMAGEESSGKSSLAIQVAESFGKRILYVDTEHTLSSSYIESLGANTSSFYHTLPPTTEAMCDIIRKEIPNFDAVIVDSINNSASDEQLGKSAGERTMANRALVLASQLPILVGLADQHNTSLIFLSQVRDNMDKMNKYDKDTIIPGGRSLHHNSSLTLELFKSSKKKEKGTEGLSSKKESIEGNLVRMKCTKNKVGKVNREVKIEFTYGKGYTLEADYAAAAEQFGIIKVTGSWVKYNDESIVQGKDKVKYFLEENPEIFDNIKQEVDFELNKILD